MTVTECIEVIGIRHVFYQNTCTKFEKFIRNIPGVIGINVARREQIWSPNRK